jgi:hypothetical protein
MESLTNEILTLIPQNDKVNGMNKIVKLVNDMRSAGLLSTPTYTLPMIDTLGNTKQSNLKYLENRNFTGLRITANSTTHEVSGW